MNNLPSRQQIDVIVLAAATLLCLYLCYRLALPFLPALAWAVALGVLFAPLQHWLVSKLKRPALAAFIAVAFIGLIIVGPMTFLGQRLVMQAADSVTLIEARVKSGAWRKALETQPQLAPIVAGIEEQLDLPGSLKTFAAWLSTATGSLLKGSVFQLIGFCLTFYLLFFFLRDGRTMLAVLRRHSPLTDTESDLLLDRVRDTIYATIYGTLAVAALQGLLGGLMFWWLGLSAPLLWGVVMALLSVVPMLGAFIVWLPAALVLLMEGNWTDALLLSVWGMFVVGTVDNLVRPILVGTRLKLHTVLAFISVVGGLMLLGSAGLILGPVGLTTTIELLAVWRRRTAIAGHESGERRKTVRG